MLKTLLKYISSTVIFHHCFEPCFSGTDICGKCWIFMTAAVKILDAALEGIFQAQILTFPISLCMHQHY